MYLANDAVGSEAFAYYISDQVFGDLPDEDVTRYRDLRVGDVIYDETADRYGIVWSIDTSDDGTCTYYKRQCLLVVLTVRFANTPVILQI